MRHLFPHNYSLRPPNWFWVILAALLITWLLSACTTTKNITEVEYRDRVEYRDKVTVDTTYVHDSTFIKLKGDTTYIYKDRYVYQERINVDTCIVQRVDSIAYPVYIEKSLSKWQEWKMDIGGYAILMLILALIYIIYKIVRR